MALLTADQILAASDVEREQVPTPEWGQDGFVYVQSMTGEARDDFEYWAYINKSESPEKGRVKNVRAKFLAMCICDEKGNLLFSEQQINSLGKKNAKVLDRCYTAASRLNAITDADVQELAKNSEAAPSGDSTSA